MRNILVCVMFLINCGYETSYTDYKLSRNLSGRVLTPDGEDVYTIERGDGLSMSAPTTNTNTNLREIFWPTGEMPNTQVCATWAAQSSETVQQGVALQIVDTPRRTRAITITKNVWAYYFLVFNIHIWDTDWEQPFVGIGQYNMSAVLDSSSGVKQLPWRICARVEASLLMFKVWLPNEEREPSWNDVKHIGQVVIPEDYVGAGMVGWYVGHIPPGGSAEYEDVEIGSR